MNDFLQNTNAEEFPMWFETLGLWIIPLLIWSLVWKGMALWKSARLNQKKWFIALLIVNTLGILEILYLYVFSKKRETTLPPNATGSTE